MFRLNFLLITHRCNNIIFKNSCLISRDGCHMLLNDNLQAVDGFEMTVYLQAVDGFEISEYLQADDSLTHRFIVPRMLPPTPFVGNSDILVPSPMVSFILRFPKQPQSTEKENENMPLSRMRVFSFTPWPCPDQTSGSSDNCRVTDVNLESQVTDPPQVRTYRCVGSVVKR